jgi:hypothetical protein
MLWLLWLLAAVVVHYVQDFARSDAIGSRSKCVFGLIIMALIFLLIVLVTALASPERRTALVARRTDLPPASATLRCGVWLIALLAFGAAVAPSML